MAHLHDVIDDDLHFKIDPDTRKISRTSENPIVIVQNDHNSERCSFEIPREIDGHDMTLCNNVRIHFLNADVANPTNMSKGVYEATDLDVLDIDPNTLLFTWLIHRNSTIHAGPLNFAISFQCTSEKIEADGSKSIIVEYEWNTLPDTEDISVSGGMDNSEVIAGEDYYDVVDTWLATITNLGETTKADVAAHITAETNSAINEAKQSIDDFAEEVKEHLGKQALSDTGVMVQETGSATDKVMSQDATTKAMEEAKTFASSEAVAVRSDLNARLDLMEATTTATRYVKQDYYNPHTHEYKLEKGNTYRIVNPTGNVIGHWGFNIYIKCTYHVTGRRSLTTGVESTETLVAPTLYFKHFGASWSPDAPTYYDTALPYTKYNSDLPCVDYPNYSDGLDFRVISYIIGVGIQDNTKYGVQQSLIYEFNGKTYYKTWVAPSEQLFDEISSDPAIEKCDILVAGGGDLLVYEDIDGPNSPSSVYEVNANGISNISKTGTSGLTDTYTIVLDDGTTKTFTVTNGDGIKSVTTPEYDDYETTYLVTFDSGATFSFKAPNANSIGIKTPATGTVIHAEDVIPAEHRVNVKVRSKNLIKYPYISQNGTVNGVTFTVNDDQSVTATGAVQPDKFSSFELAKIGDMLRHGVTYRLGDSNNIMLAYKDENGTTNWAHQGLLTWSNSYEFVQLYIQYTPGNGEVNETIHPFLCVEGESDGYTPYVDVSTAKLTRCGKNMFDSSKLLEATGWTETDGVYSGIPHAAYLKYNANDGEALLANFEPGEQYTISLECYADITSEKTQSLIFRFVYTDGSYDSLVFDTGTFTKKTLTSNPDKVIKGVHLSYAHSATAYVRNIQLEKGPVATDYEPYSGVEYDVYSNGQPATVVTSTSPTMTLFTDKPGAIIDAVYNVDQTAAYNKLKSNVPDTPAVVGTPVATRVILEPGDSYVLKPDHMYFIHGSEDSSLQVVDSATGTNALRTVAAASDIQAMITSSGDGENYGQMFVCYLKDNAVLAYSDNNVVNSISWKPMKVEQIFAPKTKVKNTHATENAYVYDYGCP